MHLVPLALGVLAISIGIAMVAFGIPINEFGTGNTLIAAGTTAIVGGFILLGLWAAVLQLQRLLGALEPHSTRTALVRVPEAAPASDDGSQPATILKSGVITGMAYPLYTDGSIEAELPQGTLRFGSLDELRDYLGGNT